MFREHSGFMEICVSHDLSRRLSIKRQDNVNDFERDQYIASKVEMRFSNTRSVL